MVLSAKSDSPAAAEALERLCATYWYPLYAFLRRQGQSHECAQDLTQGFFAHLLGRCFLEGVHPAKGRFRSFLLASLKNFVANEFDRAQAEKRGGKMTFVPIDTLNPQERYLEESNSGLTAEKMFDRAWAYSVLKQAFALLREKLGENAAKFNLLKPLLMGEPADSSYKEIAERLNTTEGALRTDCHRLRKRWFNCVREVISSTVESPEQIETELQDLIAALK